MASPTDPSNDNPARAKLLIGVALAAAVLAVAAVALLINIFEHKQEAKNPFYRVVQLTDETEDPAIWGKNFPLQYDGYLRTVDQVRTRFGGSEAVPKTPTQTDPTLSGCAIETRSRSATQNHVGRLCFCEGFSRGARPRLHARRPNFHRAANRRQATWHLLALPRLALRAAAT